MFKTLFNIAHCYGAVLGSSWVVLLDTFEQFDEIMQRRHLGAAAGLSLQPSDALLPFAPKDFGGAAPSQPGTGDRDGDGGVGGSGGTLSRSPRRTVRGKVLGMFRKQVETKIPAPFDTPKRATAASASGGLGDGHSLPPGSPAAAMPLSTEAPDDELTVLGTALSALFDSTQFLPDAALEQVVSALSELALMSLANAATAELIMDERYAVGTPTSTALGVGAEVQPSGNGVAPRRGSTASFESASSVQSTVSSESEPAPQPSGFFGSAFNAVTSVAAAAAAAVGAKDWIPVDAQPKKAKKVRKVKKEVEPPSKGTDPKSKKWSAAHKSASKSAEAATDAFEMDSDEDLGGADGRAKSDSHDYDEDDGDAPTGNSPYEEYSLADSDVPRAVSLSAFIGAGKDLGSPMTPGATLGTPGDTVPPSGAVPLHLRKPAAGLSPEHAPASPQPTHPVQPLPGSVNTNSSSQYSKMSGLASAPPPFAMMKLIETTRANLHRLSLIWDTVGALLKMLAHNRGTLIRQYGVSALAEIAAKAIVYTVEREESDVQPPYKPLSQAELLAPFADYWRTPFVDTRCLCLKALHKLVEDGGVCLDDGVDGGWLTVLGILACVADASIQGPSAKALSARGIPAEPSPLTVLCPSPSVLGALLPLAVHVPLSLSTPDPYVGSAEAVAGTLIPVGFRCLQLIADDFLAHLPSMCLSAYVATLNLFSKQMADVNVSLTAVGIMWTIADLIACPVQAEHHDEFRIVEPTRRPSASPTYAPPTSETLEIRVTTPSLCLDDDGDTLWMQLAVQLRALVCGSWASGSAKPGVLHPFQRALSLPPTVDPGCVDSVDYSVHPDVRNSAVQTLFSTFATHCDSMSYLAWREVVVTQIMPLVELIVLCCREAAKDATIMEGEQLGRSRTGDAVRMVIHHSRNTAAKQWNESRILALQGLSRLLASGFPKYRRQAWFHDVWKSALRVMECSIVGSPAPSEFLTKFVAATPRVPAASPAAVVAEPADVGCAAVQALQELALLVCVPAGPAHTSNRNTITVGMKVVNGALVMGDTASHVPPSLASKHAGAHGQGQPKRVLSGRSATSTGSTDASDASTDIGRSQMWSELSMVLDGLCTAPAVVADNDEVVAVATLECFQNLLDAVHVTVDPAHNNKPTSLIASSRATPVLQVCVCGVWCVRARASTRVPLGCPVCGNDE